MNGNPPTLEEIVEGILGGGGATTVDRATLRQMLGDLGIAVPINTADVEDAAQALLDAQNALAATATGPYSLDYIGKLKDQVQQAQGELVRRANTLWGDQGGSVAQAISEYVTSTSTRREEATEQEKLTRREYLDITTPEEFLDDFQVALATHVQELHRAGKLSVNAASWLLDNPEEVFRDYTAELGTRAARGEQIFKPVGVKGKPELLGTRPGRQETSEAQIARESLTETAEEAQRVAMATQGGVATTDTAQTVSQQKTKLTEQGRTRSTLGETEEVFGRPRLTTVYTPSPLDFLKGVFPAERLDLLYQGKKGARRAEAEFALGPPAILPRRVQ